MGFRTRLSRSHTPLPTTHFQTNLSNSVSDPYSFSAHALDFISIIMSFGFSVGDFVTVGLLIHRIISSLRTSSRAEHQELTLELHGLQQALHHVEYLKCSPEQGPAITSIKVAALACQYPLEQFENKLNKFKILGTERPSQLSRVEKLNLWRRKLQWGFSMEDEVVRLRAYLMVHVGSLNMRLITHGL